MKFTCERCGKKYATAEDPAPGRVYKLKCKACGHLIVVRASAGGAAASEAPSSGADLPDASSSAFPVPPELPPELPPPTDPSLRIEIETPEPSRVKGNSRAFDATTEVSTAAMRGHAEPELPQPAGDAGYVDLFSDVSSASELPKRSDDPFLAAARASLPESYGSGSPRAPDPFAGLREDISATSAPEPPRSPPHVPKVPVIPKPKQEKTAVPLVLIGGGVAVLVGILTFVMLSSGGKGPQPAAAPPPVVATPVPAPAAPVPEKPQAVPSVPAAPPQPAAEKADDAERRARADQKRKEREEAQARADAQARAEREARDRDAREAKARADAQARADREAKARADAQARADRDAKDREARAQREAKDREARAQREARDREARAQREARDREAREVREREKADREARAKAEREAKAQRDREAREAKEEAARDAKERDRVERQRVAAATAAEEPEGGLTQAQIEGVLRSTKSAFDACIQAARGTDVQLDGRRVMMRLNIQTSGAVTYPTIDDVNLAASDLGSCLKSAARLMVFPKFKGDTMRVEVPLVMR